MIRFLNSILKAVFLSIFLFSCEGYNIEKLPDLIVINTNLTPSTISKGADIVASSQVRNQGNAEADFPLLQDKGLYYYLSVDMRYGNDTELGNSNIDDIIADALQDVSGKNLTIPASTAPGRYYILFYVDKAGDIEESNEKNNISYYEIEVLN